MFVICWSSMVVDIYYNSRSHPSGYTDDLGIMSDKNQWVDAALDSIMASEMSSSASARKQTLISGK